jgi:capsular exopolysaccharide synthesis family protein
MDGTGQSTSDSLSRNQGGESSWTLDPRDLIEIFYRKRLLIVMVAVSALVLTTVYHFSYPSYSAKSYLLVDSANEDSGLQALLGSFNQGDDRSLTEVETEKFLLMLKSSGFTSQLSQRILADPASAPMVELMQKPKSPISHVKRWIRDNVIARNRAPKDAGTFLENTLPALSKFGFPKKGILEIIVTSESPELCVFLSNKFLETAVQVLSGREELKLNKARSYINGKIQETVGKLEDVDQNIIGLTTKNSELSLLAPQSAIAEKLLELKGEIQKLTFRKESNEKTITSLKQKVNPNENSEQTAVSRMYGVDKTIENLKVENELLEHRLEALQQGLKNILKDNLPLPKKEQLMAELKRKQGLNFYVFDNLFKTMLQIDVKGLSLINRVYPLQTVSEKEVSVSMGLPKKLLLALVASLILTCAGLYGWNSVTPLIRTRKDVDAMKMSFLGNVAAIDSRFFNSLNEYPTICNFGIDTKESLGFKHIRSRLAHLSTYSGTQQRKVISFLSYGNNEGKSFLSSNIAASFAHTAKRTLLVDFDLRRAALTKMFELKGKPGLCAYLDGQVPIEQLIEYSVIENLDVLPAGTMSSKTTETFSGQKFLALINELKPLYDFIIIDTAPLVVAHESLAIAQHSDFAVLVATSWKTRLEYIAEALDEIRNVRGQAVHIILNKTKEIKNSLVSNYYYVQPSARRVVERTLDN